MHAHVVTDSIDFFFFRKCKAWSIQIARGKVRADEKEGGEGAHPGSGIVFQPPYPRISWIDSSTFCRSERSDEQIVRKSWNASFIREGMRAARRLINMSLLSRRSSSAGFKPCAKRDIYRGKSGNLFVRFFLRGCLQLLSVFISVFLYYYDHNAIGCI